MILIKYEIFCDFNKSKKWKENDRKCDGLFSWFIKITEFYVSQNIKDIWERVIN